MDDQQNSPSEIDEKSTAKSLKKALYKEKIKSVLHLWDKEAVLDLLQGAFLAASEKKSETAAEENLNKIVTAETPSDEVAAEIRLCEKMFCTSCAASFEERDEQTDHFKSDWHRFNLKRRLRSQEYVSEQKFEEITNAGDLSSISGSDSSSEEENTSSSHHLQEDDDEDEDCHLEGIGKRHPRVFMRNNNGELFSVYRCVVHGKKNVAESAESLVSMVRDLPREMTWAVIMMAGGHFAAAIFEGNSVVEHKTFHRYVVRAKRGTVQSSRDGKGHAPKSGGASLRRYNEAALGQEIHDLLSSWSHHITRCSRIFLRAPTYSKSTFHGGKNPILTKTDSRIRLVPFPTRRPTFKELHRVHELLATIECYGCESTLEDHIMVSLKKTTPGKLEPTVQKKTAEPIDQIVLEKERGDPADTDDVEISAEMMAKYITIDTQSLQEFEATKKPKKKKKNREKHQKEEDDSSPFEKFTDPENRTLRNELYTACKTKNTERLRTLLHDLQAKNADCKSTGTSIVTSAVNSEESGETNLTISDIAASESTSLENCEDGRINESTKHLNDTAEMLNYPFGDHGLTLLHVAGLECHKEAVSLLMELGADPCIKDGQGRLPYISAANKDSRNEFRRFMAKYPDMYNYQKAQIPGPLSEEHEKDKKSREAERKKLLKKSKKERLKDQKAEEAQDREEERERRRYLTLSDREKRALAAEKRLTTQFVSTGQVAPILLRCFQCANDITGKVPFEYADFKFCTTKCLKEHRLVHNAKKS